MQAGRVVTKVPVRVSLPALPAVLVLTVVCLFANAPAWTQEAAPSPAVDSRPSAAPIGPAAALYRRLLQARLDAGQVYVVREGRLDREDVRITLLDGTIAFLRAIDGRVTGAFFEGEGEVLIMPPDRAERDHLGLFTGASILHERFSSAFFRFNDDVFRQLQPALRRPVDGAGFVARHDETVAALAPGDALRLLHSFVNSVASAPPPGDRMLRARLAGQRLGIIDVYFDTTLQEQIWAGQVAYDEGRVYFDRWLSFPMRSLRRQSSAREPAPLPSAGKGALGRDQSAVARVLAYNIRTQVRPPHELEAQAELALEALEPGQRMLTFELSRYLKVRSAEFNGHPVEFIQNEAVEGTDLARRGNDLVAVILPHALSRETPQRLRFVYGGEVMSDAGGGLLYVGARGIWYPNLGVVPARFDLEFRFPSEWTLVATGERSAEHSEAAWKVSRWVTPRPIPLAGFNLGRYESALAHAGPVRVETHATPAVEDTLRLPPRRVLVPRPTPRDPMGTVVRLEPPPPPPRPARHAQMLADQTARTIEFLSQRLGPFPYDSLTISQMPGRASQGWPTLVFLSSYAFLTPEEKAALRLSPYESVLFGHLVQAHETAHQWWGASVLWESYRDQWLMEALANYSALLQVEAENPRAFDLILGHYRSELLQASPSGKPMLEAGPVTLGLRLASSRFPSGYDVVTYARGTWLIHMLRHLFLDATRLPGALPGKPPASPDEPFLRALRRLHQRFAGRTLSTHDFRRVLEEVLQEEFPPQSYFEGRPSLDWFFEEWVEGIAVPALALDGVRFFEENGRRVATGRILQRHAPETMVTSVPLWAETPEGRRFLARVFVEDEGSRFRLEVPAATQRLLLDPENTVLTRP